MGTDALRMQGRVFYCWICLIFMLAALIAGTGSAVAAPTVTAGTPAADAAAVPVATTVTAVFSEPLDPATVTFGSFVLSQSVRVSAIAAGFNYTLLLKDNGTVSGWGYNSYGQTTVPGGLGDVIAVAAGSNHSVALKKDGTVGAWGENAHGQTTIPAGLTGVTAIAAGTNFTLALKADGSVVSWGDNSAGQTSIPGGLAGVSRIAAGSSHVLALKADGTVVAWGDNASGQTLVSVGLAGVTAVAAGLNHSLALRADGSVVAWGANGSGQISVPAGLEGVIAIAAGANGSVALKDNGSVVAWGDNSYGQTTVPPGLGGITAIAAGYYHMVALKNDGTVVSWGDNSCSQTRIPVGLAGVIAVSAGASHPVALKSDGTLFAWGYNSDGQADIPAGLTGVTATAAGFAHTLALSGSGSVTVWGRNDNGQIIVPPGLSGVIAVAAGDNHSVALKNDGTVVAWGLNTAGQATVPGGLAAVANIAAGSAHTLVLKQGGSVAAWGSNAYDAVSIPLGLTGVTAIAAAGYHSLALKSDGSLIAWGDNTSGQSTVPAGLTAVSAIAAGSSHSVALKSDGTVVAWGANDKGQSAVPAGLAGVVAIAAGNGYTVAVKNDGTLVSWGDNKVGQATVPQDPYGLNMAAAVDYSSGNNSATLTPVAALPPATTLTATVNSGVRSLEGVHPAADYSWSFTTVATPVTTASPAGGTYSAPQSVTLTASEPATIYYTTNGATPTTASSVYSGPLAISVTTALKFFARDPAGNSEVPQTAIYTLVADIIPPVTTVSPAGGTYSSSQSVILTANEPATIYYTTNGAMPSNASPVYSGPIPIPASTTLKFFARDTAGNSEAVKSAIYTINLDTIPPVTTVSPPGGVYSSARSVILTANEPATIYYTTNGATPSTASPVYSGSIPIPASTTLKFFARDTAGNSEAVKSAVYTINLDTIPPVTTASPPGGVYSSARSVTLTANEPATIYYTTNGATPSTASGVYSGAIPIPVTSVLKFFSRDTAGNSETLRTESYTIKQDQIITFGPLAAKTYGDASFSLGAVSSSGLPVSYTSSNSAVATVSGNTVTIVGVGSAVITASQGGDSVYNPAPAIARSLIVSKANQTIIFGPLAVKTYGEPNFTLSATANSGLPVSYTSSNSAVATISGALLTIVGAGSATITASQGGDGNYSPATAVIQALTVTKAPLTVQAVNASREYGAANPVFSVSYSGFVNGDSPVVLSGSAGLSTVATATSPVGSYAITVTADTLVAANYSFSFVNGVLTVSKANQAVTFAALPARTYGDPTVILSATASSGLPVSYTSSNSAVATINGTVLTIVGAGSATITASQGGDGAYNPAVAVGQALTVTKALLTVQATDATRAYGVENPAFSVTYSGFSNGDSPAVLSGAAGLFTSATASSPVGSYAITADAGSLAAANYSFSFVNGTLIVTKAEQAIIFGALAAKTYGDPAFGLSATAGSGLPVSYTSSNSAVATVSGTTVTIVGAGSATIHASQSGDGNYQAALTVAQLLTVSKAAATVTLASLTTTYDGVPKAATATTVPAGLTVTLTYNGVATAPTAVASYSVVGTVSDPNYQGSASGTMIIAKGNQTITFDALPVKTFGDPVFTLAATADSGLAVTYTSSNPAVATVSGSTVTIVGAGTATITANQGGNGNYNAAAAVARLLTVNKAMATLAFGQLTFTYDGTPKPVTVTTLPAGLTLALTYDGSATAPIDVGRYTVVATVNDANYQGSATATEEISKKSQTITFDPLPVKSYGDAPFTFSASASSNLNLTFEYDKTVATITKQGQKYLLTIVGAGTTVITATQAGNRNYSDAPPVSQTLIVNKAAGTVNLGSLSATYDGSAKTATATTNPVGLGVMFTYNGSAVAPTAAGSYSVSGTINDPNYQGSASGTLVIAKASQLITFGPLSTGTYGNAPFNPNASASSGLTISYSSSNPAVATVSGAIVTIVGIGTTTITAAQGGDGNYTAAPAVPQTLTVGKGLATVTFDGLSVSYNGTARTATVTTVPSGLPVALTYNGSATAPLAVGTYTVAASVTDPNYEGTASGTLIVAKGVQTITFDALPLKTAVDAPFPLSATSTSGLAISFSSSNPAVATLNGTIVTIVGAGTTTISAAQGGDGNYTAAAAVPQTLTVAKGAATVTLGGLSVSYNGTPQAATATTVPSGLPVTLTYNGSATLPMAAGSYTVAATITSPNYQGSSSGTLTIAKGAQSISFGALPLKTVGNAPFSPGATSTSGLAVSYSSSNPAVATISGTTVTIVAAGTATITASQGGDTNYAAATAVARTLTVTAAPASGGKTAVTIGAVTSYFDTVTAALATITPGSTANVKLQTLIFAEAVNLNLSGTMVSISGGYDSGFTGAAGMTTIQGVLTISAGTLIADRLVVR